MKTNTLITIIVIATIAVVLLILAIVYRNQLFTMVGVGEPGYEQEKWIAYEDLRNRFQGELISSRFCEKAGGTIEFTDQVFDPASGGFIGGRANCNCPNLTLGGKYPVTNPPQAAKFTQWKCDLALTRYTNFRSGQLGGSEGLESTGSTQYYYWRDVLENCNPQCDGGQIPTQCRLSTAEVQSGVYAHSEGMIPMSQYRCSSGQSPSFSPVGENKLCTCVESCISPNGSSVPIDLFDHQQCSSDEKGVSQNGICACTPRESQKLLDIGEETNISVVGVDGEEESLECVVNDEMTQIQSVLTLNNIQATLDTDNYDDVLLTCKYPPSNEQARKNFLRLADFDLSGALCTSTGGSYDFRFGTCQCSQPLLDITTSTQLNSCMNALSSSFDVDNILNACRPTCVGPSEAEIQAPIIEAIPQVFFEGQTFQ